MEHSPDAIAEIGLSRFMNIWTTSLGILACVERIDCDGGVPVVRRGGLDRIDILGLKQTEKTSQTAVTFRA